MTLLDDTLNELDDALNDDENPDEPLADLSLEGRRQCARVMSNGEQCPEYLPADAPDVRLYCEEHKNGKKKKKAADEPTPASVKRPATKKVDKASSDAEKVEAGALAMLAFIPLFAQLAGDTVCANAFVEALPAIAKQLGELSRYHPALKKVFAPGEGTGEALVWVSLAIVSSPVIIAVLTHHNIVKGKVAENLNAATDSMKLIIAAQS